MTLDDHLPAAPHGRWEWLAAGAGGVGHTGCVIAQTYAQERWHGGTCEWLSSSPSTEGDPCRCSGGAEDIDLVPHSYTDHLEVQRRRQPGQRCQTRSHPGLDLLSHVGFLHLYGCRAVAALSVRMRGNC